LPSGPTRRKKGPLAALNAWLAHRRTDTDLDWTATVTTRAADLWRNNVTEGVFRQGETEPKGA
jgi:hypothetical protein